MTAKYIYINPFVRVFLESLRDEICCLTISYAFNFYLIAHLSSLTFTIL